MVGRFFGSLFGRPAVEVVDTVAPASKEADHARIGRSLDDLRGLVRRSGDDLPSVVVSRLRQIDDLLRIVMSAAAADDASTEQRYLLEAMITDYLPTPVQSYLGLPDSDRGPDSRPTEILTAQLGVLEETIRDLLNQIRTGAIAELSTHGRFLADKFAAPSLTLDP